MQDSQQTSASESKAYIKARRPKNLNLLSVKFPMSAILSIGHRASGILLFLSLPYFLYFLQLSLTNETGFLLAKAELQGPLVKLFCVFIIWGLAHHFFSGIRYFLLDFDIGIDKNSAKKSAILVMACGFLVFIFFSILLL